MRFFIHLLVAVIFSTTSYCQNEFNWCMNKSQATPTSKTMNDLVRQISAYQKSSVEVIIPVVFHIIYNTDAENIPDSVLMQQLDIINEDFNLLNGDTNSVRSIFSSIIGNPRVSFCLANIDPDGFETSGINRSETNLQELTVAQMKSANTGIKGWPANEYLNIWIADVTEGILGFANAPWDSTPLKRDGIVLDYTIVGKGNTEKGRILTHEIGHFLGLYHPFDNNCEEISSGNCDSLGDKVCDTPPQLLSYNCNDDSQNTCTESTDDQLDNWENYMGYASGGCRVMFTQGQVDRMNAFLSIEPRASLVSSNKCSSFTGLTSFNKEILTIYPNPSSGIFYIASTLSSVNDYRIDLFDLSGNMVYQTNFNKNNKMLDISVLPKGIYVLTITINSASIPAHRKVIIK